MHAGMSLSIVDRAFLLLRSREDAWRRVTCLFAFIFSMIRWHLVQSRTGQDRTGCQYLVLAVWIADPGHVCVGKQEVECDRQEGQVSHQGEVLEVQNFLVEPV